MSSTGSIQPPPSVANTRLHIDNEVETVEKGNCNMVSDDLSLENKNVYKNDAVPKCNKINITDTLLPALDILLISSGLITCVYLLHFMAIPIFIFCGLLFILDLYADFLEASV